MGSHHQLSHSLVTRIDCISPTLLNPTHTLTMGGQEDELAQYNRVAELEPFGTPGSRMLEIERSKAAFGVDDLATYLYGKGRLEMMERIGSIVESEPAFDKKKLHYLGRKEKFEMAVNKEKRQLFLEPSLRYEYIGCYSQTELGHGSNVQGLETTATYIPEDQEFELHSPSLTAAKWWSGGLGRAATHSAVMCQLIINGKNLGPHPFIVPLRDPKTRATLPGRTIGDIGPKSGFNAVDNGFLLFNKVRIPHNCFLAKYSQIDRETGKYTKPAHSKLSYGTMTYIRAGIVRSVRDVIARSATIAIRYCAVRRQFADKDAPIIEERKPVETQVLNYSMVQYRLLPIVATAYAFHFTGAAMYKQYEHNMALMKKGDFSLLADTHASSSALKSLSTITAAQAIEDCRRACGGHGYSMASGMASQYADYLPQVTWEGDSYMLTQQTARYLMKIFRKLYMDKNAGKEDDEIPESSPTIEYLQNYLADPQRTATLAYSGDFHDPDFFVEAFGFRAADMTRRLVQKREIQRRTWNSLLIEMYKTSRAHAQYNLIRNFAEALNHDEELKKQPALKGIMQK